MSKRSKISHVFFHVPHNKQETTITTNALVIELPGIPWTPKVYNWGPERLTSHAQILSVRGTGRYVDKAYSMSAVRIDRNPFDFRSGDLYPRHRYGISDTSLGAGPPDYGAYGLVGVKPYYLPDVPVSLQTQVLGEAKSKLSSSDVNVATSLAEAKEALRGIASLLANMALVVGKLAKRTPKPINSRRGTFLRYEDGSIVPVTTIMKRQRRAEYAKRSREFMRTGKLPGLPKGSTWIHPDGVVDHLEKAWLTAMYGLIPTWLDLQGLCSTASRELLKEGAHVEVTRRIMRSGITPRPNTSNWTSEGKYMYGAECKLRYRMQDAHANLVASMGLTNPFAVWWELTPYSFVIDWLVPVGNMLQGLTADAGLDFHSGYEGTKSFCDFTVTGTNEYKPTGTLPSVRFRNVAHKRKVLLSSPFVGLYYKSPFSVKHGISAVALASQSLRK